MSDLNNILGGYSYSMSTDWNLQAESQLLGLLVGTQVRSDFFKKFKHYDRGYLDVISVYENSKFIVRTSNDYAMKIGLSRFKKQLHHSISKVIPLVEGVKDVSSLSRMGGHYSGSTFELEMKDLGGLSIEQYRALEGSKDLF